MIDLKPRRPRGRPREFDEARALDAAVALFSAAGFSAASVSDITEATGLTAGSLYKAYRDKEGIFAHALDRYVSLSDARITETVGKARTGRDRIARLIRLYAEFSQGESGRRGCMVVAGIAGLGQLGGTADALRATLARRRAMLSALVAEGQRDGSVATTDEPGQVAGVLLALLQGMRVVGKGGQFPADADAFVRLALKTLD